MYHFAHSVSFERFLNVIHPVYQVMLTILDHFIQGFSLHVKRTDMLRLRVYFVSICTIDLRKLKGGEESILESRRIARYLQ